MTLPDAAILCYTYAACKLWRAYLAAWCLYIQIQAMHDL